MKWIKQDIYGNEQVWYSGDIIEKIKSIIKPITKQNAYDPDLDKILAIIESEDK